MGRFHAQMLYFMYVVGINATLNLISMLIGGTRINCKVGGSWAVFSVYLACFGLFLKCYLCVKVGYHLATLLHTRIKFHFCAILDIIFDILAHSVQRNHILMMKTATADHGTNAAK